MHTSASSAGRWRRVLVMDESLLIQVTRLHAPRLTSLMLGLTRIGDAESWVFLISTAFIFGGPALGLRLAIGALGATVPAHLLKRVLRRARPTGQIIGFAAVEPDPDAFSFPSGHTATAFGIGLSLLASHSYLSAPALILAVGIGASRIYLGAHYPLDVAVGAVLGGFGAVASMLLLG